jgi:hypothetical protein
MAKNETSACRTTNKGKKMALDWPCIRKTTRCNTKTCTGLELSQYKKERLTNKA